MRSIRHLLRLPQFGKIVKSFARIHKENLIDFGILPLVFADPSDYDNIAQGDLVELSGLRDFVASGLEEVELRVSGSPIRVVLDVSPRHRKILLAGGILNLARD